MFGFLAVVEDFFLDANKKCAIRYKDTTRIKRMIKWGILFLTLSILVLSAACRRAGTSSEPEQPQKTKDSHQRPTVVVDTGPPFRFKLTGDGSLMRVMVGEVKRDE